MILTQERAGVITPRPATRMKPVATVSSWSVSAARYFASKDFLDRDLSSNEATNPRPAAVLTIRLGDVMKGLAQ